MLLVGAAIGGRDESGETVPAGEWAQSVCGAVGVWRGEIEAIVEDIRTPSSQSSVGEEPHSETPQGRAGFIRKGLEQIVQAAETLVEGVDNAGIPDTEEGEEAAERVSEWANDAQEELEEAQDSLDVRLRISRSRSTSSPTRHARSPPSSRADADDRGDRPARSELARVVVDTSTCQQLRAERTE